MAPRDTQLEPHTTYTHTHTHTHSGEKIAMVIDDDEKQDIRSVHLQTMKMAVSKHALIPFL